jgi:hypothetical protein
LNSSIDGIYNITIHRGILNSAEVILDTPTPGTVNDVNVSFTTTNVLPTDGTIVTVFPAEFNLTLGNIIASIIGVDSEIEMTISGQELTIERDGTGTDTPAGEITIMLSGVTNPATAGPTGDFSIKTTTSDGAIIDTSAAGTGVSPVIISGFLTDPSIEGVTNTSINVSFAPGNAVNVVCVAYANHTVPPASASVVYDATLGVGGVQAVSNPGSLLPAGVIHFSILEDLNSSQAYDVYCATNDAYKVKSDKLEAVTEP